MSSEVKNYSTKNYLAQEYNAEWIVVNLSSLGTESIRTPIFSPVPNSDLKLYFELWYRIIKMAKRERDVSCFKLVLRRLGKSNETNTSLKLKMNVTVDYSDGTVYKLYKSPASISVENIDVVTCADVTSEFYSYQAGRYEKTSHNQRMESNKLIIKFHTKFYGHLCTPAIYYQKMENLGNLKSFVRNYKAIYESKAFSDVLFLVEEKTLPFLVQKKKLPAHKVVLSAHSPVFSKMLEHDFVESKTNTITITDYDSVTFETFLKFLYFGEIENKTWPFIKDLYTLSDKYAVQALKQDCAEVMAADINMANACDILEIGFFYDDKKLKDEGISFAVQHFDELTSSENWETLVSNYPLIGYELLRTQSDHCLKSKSVQELVQ